jgi:hypothetical protein
MRWMVTGSVGVSMAVFIVLIGPEPGRRPFEHVDGVRSPDNDIRVQTEGRTDTFAQRAGCLAELGHQELRAQHAADLAGQRDAGQMTGGRADHARQDVTGRCLYGAGACTLFGGTAQSLSLNETATRSL